MKLKKKLILIGITVITLFFFKKSFLPNKYNLSKKLNFSDAWSRLFVSSNFKPRKIFVFDFDLTLTLRQTHGIPIDNKFTLEDLFGEYLETLKNIFKKIVNKGNCIFINTRACKKQVEKVLENANLMQYIEYVYGASCPEEIMHPHKYAHLWKDKNDLNSDEKWAIIKQYFLDKIKYKYKRADIYYFDDTKVNIVKAKEKYSNCFLAREGSLSELICEIKQIMKFKH